MTIGRKGTGSSDAERLGKCSMPVKTFWACNFQSENIRQPKSVTIHLFKFYWANITLAGTEIYKGHPVICTKDQLVHIVTTGNSLQLAGQNLESKTDNFNNNKNWGFPKGGNSYHWARTIEWYGYKRPCHGNGVSVIWANNSKGGQPPKVFFNLSGRFYSTGKKKTIKPEINRVIECTYRQLFDIDIYKSAYQILKSNPGNMTKGTDNETLDGISLNWGESIIKQMKNRDFQFKPSLRVYIPKANGKLRPLGIPSPKDKIVQQAIKMIIESVYEPIFHNTSHGFRPNRSTTTALYEVRKWNGITWIIEGDIKGYFDNIDHHILASLLKKQIKDSNIIDLYWKLVKAGYVNDGSFSRSNLGVPQGGVLSPLLSNIYLHEFDTFMETLIDKYSNPDARVSKANPAYTRVKRKITKLEQAGKLTPEQIDEHKALKLSLIKIPSVVRDDSTATRVYYNRYADDWVVGISGSLSFTQKVKEEIKNFLNCTLKLTLSEEKTKITHLETNKVKYLGYLVSRRNRRYTESQISSVKSTQILRRPSYASITIEAPIDLLVKKLIEQGYAKDEKKPIPKAISQWIFMKPEDIIMRFNAVIRGLLGYYSFVENRNQFSYILWILKFSAVFTLARKLNISSKEVWRKYGNPITVNYTVKDTKRSIKLYDPKTLSRDRTFKIKDYLNFDPFTVKYFSVRSRHIWDEDCIICGSSDGIEIHHVKHIRKGKIEGFTQIMKQLNRKQIPVCHTCHTKIHSGKYDGIALNKIKTKTK